MNRQQINRIAAVSAVFVALVAGTLAVHAGENLVTTVPFEFTIDHQTLPAGDYQFQVDQVAPKTVLVRSMDNSTVVIATYQSAGNVTRDGAPYVKFNSYGERRFLTSIKTTNGVAVTFVQGSEELTVAKMQTVSATAVAANR